VLNNLRNTFRGSDLITAADIPAIDTMIESLCGKPPALSVGAVQTPKHRENLTSIPWIAPDDLGQGISRTLFMLSENRTGL
jgi:hypothetical protein